MASFFQGFGKAAAPHPAMLAETHLWPALRTFWPDFTAHFHKYSVSTLSRGIQLYYAHANPLHSAIAICAFFSAFVYITQQVTGNASQVDRLWTFLPVIYTAHFTFQSYFAKLIDPSAVGSVLRAARGTSKAGDAIVPRLALLFFLQVLWSARLTFHAIRRGFFKKGEEDYRWPLLRAKMPRWAWELFALFFIAIAQNILLALTALPQYMILTSTTHKLNTASHPATSLTPIDYLLGAVGVVNLALEMASDQQQWTFQNYKRGKDASGNPLPASERKAVDANPDVKRGFVTRGLFAYSRHPNFLFEQINWWIYWSFVLVTFYPGNRTAPWHSYVVTYALISPLLMNVLFISSTIFTEAVSAGKYPSYAAYQRRVGMFLPFPDTFLRALYYRFIASESSRKAVEEQVWGDRPKTKSS